MKLFTAYEIGETNLRKSVEDKALNEAFELLVAERDRAWSALAAINAERHIRMEKQAMAIKAHLAVKS